MLHRYNLNRFKNPKIVETDEGFLQIKGNILKADSFMNYMDKTGVLREKIPKEILFNEETKKSFLYKKITLEHPFEKGKLVMVNSENVANFGKGTIVEVFENGDCLGATLQVEDNTAIDFIKNKMKNNENIELSAGYQANVEHLKENEYIQKDIIANHVAILSGKGRAGSDVKLIYNYSDYKEDNNMKLKFNGKDMTSEELLVEATELQIKLNAKEQENEELEKEKKKLEEEKNASDEEKAEKEKELEEEKKEKEKVQNKLNELEKEIKEQQILGKAKLVLNSVGDQKEITEIMKQVIKEANPKFNVEDNATVESLEDKFNFALEVLENLGRTITEPSSNGEKFNLENGNSLSLNIDNTYFSKKRAGGAN